MSPRQRGQSSNRSGRSSQQRRRQQGRRTRAGGGGAGFWGDPSGLPVEQPDVRITGDPTAVVRSLGPPPLPGHEAIAEHYFAVVYDRAVTLAAALAAAGGLIEHEELPEDGDE